MTSTELLIQNGITIPQTLSDTIVANTLTTLWIDCWDVISYIETMKRTLAYEWKDNSLEKILHDRINYFIQSWN